MTRAVLVFWHWTSVEEKDSSFVCYVGYDAQSDTYYYWETEEEAQCKEKKQRNNSNSWKTRKYN